MPYPMPPDGANQQRDAITQALMNVQNPAPRTPMPPGIPTPTGVQPPPPGGGAGMPPTAMPAPGMPAPMGMPSPMGVPGLPGGQMPPQAMPGVPQPMQMPGMPQKPPGMGM